MKLALYICAAFLAVSEATSVSPLQKVLELLDGMLAKSKQEKHDEEKAFASFQAFCESTTGLKKKSIAYAEDQIQKLGAELEKAESDAETLGSEVEELDASLAGWAEEMKAATAQRAGEKEEFKAIHEDYSESLYALDNAIRVLKEKTGDVPQQAAMLALEPVTKSKVAGGAARAAIHSLMQAKGKQPAPNAYESQSSGVVEMLEKLRKKFAEELRAVEKEEMNRQHAYDMIMQRLTDETNHGQAVRKDKAVMKAQRLEDAAQAKEELAETTKAKEEDEQYLQDLTANCHQKSQDFEARQTLRAAEIEAIGKAMEILSSPTVSGAADKHLPSMLQAAPVLAQLRATPKASDKDKRATALLTKAAAASGSRLLTMVAGRIAEDPFAKVKKLIKDLIVRLMEEAEGEADHKAWCDKELAMSKQTREEKSAEVDELQAEVDGLGAKVAKLAEDITELSDDITAISAAVAKATEERQAEKAKNTETIAEAKAASEAVLQAIAVLKEFYEKAASATALAQQPDAPQIFEEPYKGLQSENGGVIGFLEVVQSDFARLEAETSSAEDEAAREYKTFMNDSAVDKATKETDLKHKINRKEEFTRDLADAKKELGATMEELAAANAYFEKLKPSCIDVGISYEERVQRRKEEIIALQEALKILEGEDLTGGA